MGRRSNRREFLKQTSLAGVGFWVAGGVTLADSKSPNEKLNFACIGVGGKGSSDTDHVARHGNVVALCDIDEDRLNGKANHKEKTGEQLFAKAKKYNDFRKMLEEMDKQIDAVTVSTPDHTHAVASLMAMKMGKHVYCQKPLTHTVYEARMMRETAANMKVCTQMGNQGSASNGLRRAVEIIQAGVIGPVREAHVWTNRPIWPQAPKITARPQDTPPCPSQVHWDLFLGPAPERPYSPAYHPFAWRGWWDFGTGALGDMACHTANMAYRALKLGYPTSILAESGPINPETYPGWARILFEFPAREDMPPVKLTWYEGKKDGVLVHPPEELLAKVLKPGEKLSGSGSLLVGDKGILFSPNDYGESYRFVPEKDFEGYKGPAESLPRNGKGDDGMKVEWIEAIKSNKPQTAYSNFGIAAMLTETILLGNVAMRVGKRLEWDGPGMRVTNCPEAAQYIKPEFRKGWTV
jgi:predicted dehydrogenase